MLLFKYLDTILFFMARAPTLLELLRYNVTQKILEELADAESRAILFSSVKDERSAAELSEMLHIPLSSVYKKLTKLEWLTLMTVTRTAMDTNRKRVRMYRSRIAEANITIRDPEPTTILMPNEDRITAPNTMEPPQQNEFDISRMIIEELNNTRSRAVLFSIKNKAKNSRTIALEEQMPLSAVTDSLERLEYLGLLERSVEGGRDTGKYKSRISGASITIKNPEPVLVLMEN